MKLFKVITKKGKEKLVLAKDFSTIHLNVNWNLTQSVEILHEGIEVLEIKIEPEKTIKNSPDDFDFVELSNLALSWFKEQPELKRKDLIQKMQLSFKVGRNKIEQSNGFLHRMLRLGILKGSIEGKYSINGIEKQPKVADN